MNRPWIVLSAMLAASFAQAEILPMPLDSHDPEQPIELIGDVTWSGADVQASRGQWSKLSLPAFEYEAAKGPIRLVVDYAALRTSEDRGDALIDIGIECPQASQPCAIPISAGTIGIRTDYMGEHVARIDGEPTAVWVGRESHSYSFPDGTLVDVWLSLVERNHLDPKAIRARLFYGTMSNAALPGQATRSGTFLKIAAVVLGLAVLAAWWLRRS